MSHVTTLEALDKLKRRHEAGAWLSAHEEGELLLTWGVPLNEIVWALEGAGHCVDFDVAELRRYPFGTPGLRASIEHERAKGGA